MLSAFIALVKVSQHINKQIHFIEKLNPHSCNLKRIFYSIDDTSFCYLFIEVKINCNRIMNSIGNGTGVIQMKLPFNLLGK